MTATAEPVKKAIRQKVLESYRNGQASGLAIYGYYFRILKSQGPAAAGGVLDYVIIEAGGLF